MHHGGFEIRSVLVLFIAAGWCACSAGGADAPQSGAGTEFSDERIVWQEVDSAELGIEGGMLQTPDGGILFYLPENALSESVTLRLLVPVENLNDKGLLVEGRYVLPGTRVRIEPVDLVLAAEASLTIRVDPEVIPVALKQEDVGFYRSEASPSEGWGRESVAYTRSRTPGFFGGPEDTPDTVRFTAFSRLLGTWRVAIHDPYQEQPQIEQIRGGQVLVVSNRQGIQADVPNRAGVTTLFLDGNGFGWDPALVRVTMDGEEVDASVLYNRMIAISMDAPGPLSAPVTRNVQVRVRDRSSNVMPIRIAASQSCVADVEQVRPPLGQPGARVRVDGRFCGSLQTRLVHFGGETVQPELNYGIGAGMVAEIPQGLPSGWVDVRVSDGVGGEPGGAQAIYILSTDPVELRPGLHEAGLVIPRTTLGADRHSIPLILEVEGLEPWFETWDFNAHRTEVRFRTPQQSTEWELLTGYDNVPPSCGSAEGPGHCFVEVPLELLSPLEDGDELEVTIRRTYRGGVPLPGEAGSPLTRTSNPVSIPVHPEAFAGMTNWVSVSENEPHVRFCSNWAEDRYIVARGDMVCLQDTAPQCSSQHECEDEATLISAPALFEGTLRLGDTGSAPGFLQSTRAWCFIASELGEYEIHNLTLGRTCTVDVRTFTSRLRVVEVVPEEGIVVGAGGVRFEIPPGALPAPSDGAEAYTLSVRARDDWYGEDSRIPLIDIDTFVEISFQPQVYGFYHSPILTIPDTTTEGTVGAPELGLAELRSGSVHFLDQVRQLVDGALQWELPAGLWGNWPDGVGAGLPQAMPLRVNSALNHVGVLHRTVEPGMIMDAQGRILVDYVVDPTSAHHVDDATAQQVLAAAVEAYDELARLGWRLPSEVIRIYIQETVSWADVEGKAEGATTAGFLGQPTVAIRSTLPNAAAFRYVTMHEIGHVFQREYRVEPILTWLDEGTSEWVAWRLLGEEYPLGALIEDSCAVELATRAFPETWTMIFGPKCHYGSAAWLIWLDENYGPDTIRRIYEILSTVGFEVHEPRNVLPAAADGLGSMSQFQEEYGPDFWSLQAPVVDRLTLYGQQIGLGMNVFREINQPQTLQISLANRPNLSSTRYRIHVTEDALDDPLYSGDLVLRATGLGSLQDLIVLHEPGRVMEMSDDPEHVVTLSADAPPYILPGIRAGTWWVVDNNTSPATDISGHTLAFELPRISTPVPAAAFEGGRVTLSGDSLGSAPGSLLVGGQSVAPISWSASQVRFDMPYFANTSSVGVVLYTHEGARTNQVFMDYLQAD